MDDELIRMVQRFDGLFMLDSSAPWIDIEIQRLGHEILDFIAQHRQSLLPDTIAYAESIVRPSEV